MPLRNSGGYVKKIMIFTKLNIRSDTALVANWKKPTRNLLTDTARSTQIYLWNQWMKKIIFSVFPNTKNLFLIYTEPAQILSSLSFAWMRLKTLFKMV